MRPWFLTAAIVLGMATVAFAEPEEEQRALVPPPPRYNVELGVAGVYDVAVSRDAMGSAPRELAGAHATARWIGRHNYYVATPIVAIDGGAAWAAHGAAAYDLHARVGTRFHFYPWNGSGYYGGITGGVGVERVGGQVPPAWTVPVDGFLQAPLGHGQTLIGVHGGPRFALGDRALGWNGGLDYVVREWVGGHRGMLPDVEVSLEANRLAGATYVGLSVGFVVRPRQTYWERR